MLGLRHRQNSKLIFLALDHNPNNPDEFNPKKISKIFDFLTKVDRVHF